MGLLQKILLGLVLVVLVSLFFATFPSIGSVIIGFLLLLIVALLLWQRFLNR